jgi:hypothetical protein
MNLLRRLYDGAWKKRPNVRVNDVLPNYFIKANEFPEDSRILIIDINMKLKYMSGNITCGISFVKDHVLKETKEFFKQRKDSTVILCFDTLPRQINKNTKPGKKEEPLIIPTRIATDDPIKPKNETIIREKDIIPTEIYEVDEDYPLISNDTIIGYNDAKLFEAFSNNPKLFPELISYITKFLIDPTSLNLSPEDFYKIPDNCRMFLWGGSLATLEPRAKRVQISKLDMQKNTFESCVYYLSSILDEEKKNFKQESGRCSYSMFNIPALQNLKEADLSILYFTSFFKEENVTVLTGDGDLIFQLLLQSKDRIDENNKWRNIVYVQRLKKSNTGLYVEEVNINRLYELITNDERINLKKGILDPVLFWVALSILVESDFTKDYCYGIGDMVINKFFTPRPDIKGKFIESDEHFHIPYIFFTFFNNPHKYRHLFMYKNNTRDQSINPIHINEDLFITFTRECYYHKYKKTVASNLGKDENSVVINDIRNHLSQKNEKTRMAPQAKIRVKCRNLLWTLNYWFNKHKSNGEFPPSPILQFNNLPIYGWIQSTEFSCKQATKVSKLPELDEPFIKLNNGEFSGKKNDIIIIEKPAKFVKS